MGGRDGRERGERGRKRVEGGREEGEREERRKGERRVKAMMRKGRETDFCTHHSITDT